MPLVVLIHDRIESDELVMTQEFIANILGGRRETVTVAAGRLQDAGLIRYRRGRLQIMDRKGLEDAVCECYRPVGVRAGRPVTSEDGSYYFNAYAKPRAELA